MTKKKKNSSKESTPMKANRRESNLNSDINKLDSDDVSAYVDSNNFMDNEMMEPRSNDAMSHPISSINGDEQQANNVHHE